MPPKNRVPFVHACVWPLCSHLCVSPPGPENVWGSAGVPLLLTFPLYLNSTPLHPVLPLAILGTFATKLSDTFASEIGKAYGKTTFLITTFRRVPPGTEGAVSLEGTVGGILGALVMTLCGAVLGTVTSYKVAGVVMLSAFLATSVESVIGATVQEGRLSNEMVNFIMCVIGAGFNIYFGRKVV